MGIFRGRELYLRTLVYILSVIVFFGTWKTLGPGTAFIGATIAKGSLVLMNTDLTGNPIRSTLTFITVFIFIGLASFIASINIYLGLIVNFAAIFILTYNFVSNLKQLIWRPFVLGYLYLLIEPGTFKELPYRVITLGLGALFLMLTQIILNKNKSANKIKNGMEGLLDEISKKIQVILEGKSVIGSNFKVMEHLNAVVTAIYSKRIDPFFITKKDNVMLNIALYVERLNYILKEINIDLNNEIEKEFIIDLKRLILDFKEIIKEKEPNLEVIDRFIKSHEHKAEDDYYLYEILQNLEMLKNCVNENKITKREILLNRKLRHKVSDIFKFKISRDSLRFSFAFRASILLAVTYFLVNYFKIEEGKWIVFTIYAVIEPFYEETKKRFPKRFKGTVLGIGIFILIYLLVKNVYVEGLIFIILYYVYVISKDFQIKTMCTATVSLGLFAIVTQNPSSGIVLRITFVVVGIVLGYLGTKFILPYNREKSLERLIALYYKLSGEIFEFIFKEDKDQERILNEKMLLSKLYESRIIGSNAISNNSEFQRFVYNQRILNNLIYFLIISTKNKNLLKEELNYIEVHYKNHSEEEILKEMNNYFKEEIKKLDSNEEKLMVINLQRVVMRLRVSRGILKRNLKEVMI